MCSLIAECVLFQVRDELKKLKTGMAKQKLTDRATFSGLFDRGDLSQV